MTDDIVARLRRDLASGLSASIGDTEEAADRIEELEKALIRIWVLNQGRGSFKSEIDMVVSVVIDGETND